MRILGGAIALVVVGIVAIRVVAAVTSEDPVERSFLIVRDESIGSFPRDGTIADAVELLGQPTARIPGGLNQCDLTWPSRGITMNTVFPGAANPCGPKGNHLSTTVTDKRWETDEGLRVGDPAARIQELYPDAGPPNSDGVVELFTRDFSGLPLPSLTATVAKGRVTAFTLYGPQRGF
ncbi:MAG: hypothetical protein ACYC1P_02725 [Gaiellaceae bacterium]